MSSTMHVLYRALQRMTLGCAKDVCGRSTDQPVSAISRPERRGDLFDLLMRHGRLIEPMAPQRIEIPPRSGLEGGAQVPRGHLAPGVAGGEVVQCPLKSGGADLVTDGQKAEGALTVGRGGPDVRIHFFCNRHVDDGVARCEQLEGGPG